MLYRSHRGGVYYTPENTMPAFRAAFSQRYAYIETDPCCTKDGVIVLHHDGTINRTCRNNDGTKIPSSVRLCDLTYEELMQKKGLFAQLVEKQLIKEEEEAMKNPISHPAQ